MNPTSKRNPSPFLPAFFFKSTFTTWHSNISWETKCSFEDHMDKVVCHSGGIPVKTWWANTFWYIEALLTRRAAVPPLFFSPPAFGGCYWKPWLQALIVYFVLPFFSWRPSHDNAVGMTDKAGQKFHRSTAKLPRRSMSYTANYSSVCKTEACKNAFVCTLNNVQL